MKDKLLVNQIIPFSNVDGDGNRLSIFVQGCNLNCLYCHNSETINVCNNCGLCVDNCPSGSLSLVDGIVRYDSQLCTDCDSCITICPNQSSPKAKFYDMDELIGIIKEYRPYLRGITISGGEPTLNWNFIKDLFVEVKKLSLSCYIDTNGYFDFYELKELIEETDGFLFDIKAINRQKSLCGVHSSAPIENLKKLLVLGKIAEVRTVVLTDLMDSEHTVSTVSKILCKYKGISYRIIRAHLVGLKSDQKDKIKDFIPSDDFMNHLQKLAMDEGAEIILKQLV